MFVQINNIKMIFNNHGISPEKIIQKVPLFHTEKHSANKREMSSFSKKQSNSFIEREIGSSDGFS